MFTLRARFASLAPLAILAGVLAPPAQGEVVPNQLLDRVEVVSPTAVLEMSFKDTTVVPQFDTPPVSAGQVSSCQLTATRGLFCLDQLNGKKGRLVRQWNPVETGSDSTVFSCEDTAFGFDTAKTVQTCTALTVSDDGGIWVAGKKKSTYSLVKVVEKGSSCDNSKGWYDLNQEPSTQYCFKEYARDRPLLVDTTATKLILPGSLLCAGVIGLELKKTLMFFPDPDLNATASGCPTGYVEIANSKTWGLKGTELLQSASIFKPEDGTVSVALATSTIGRILAKDTTNTPLTAVPVFSVPDERNTRSTIFEPRRCDLNDANQQYGIRAGTKSGRIYVTDHNWCEVLALEPVLAGNPSSGLENVTIDSADLTLSTFACPYTQGCTDTTFYAPLQPTLAPGESIDLSECGDGEVCPLSYSRTDPTLAAANLTSVNLVSSQTGMTLFQIENLPDCRWLAQDNQTLPAICTGAGVISGGATADKQFLNVTPLLPKEVTDQFVKNPLPAMYISPDYRAQASAGRYYFDAFFGITEKGVVFTDTFDLELYVSQLAGSGQELGCRYYPQSSWPVPVGSLLQWDLTVRISENYRTVGGPATLSYADVLGNSGCASSKIIGAGFSIYAFNLEVFSVNPQIVFAQQVYSLYYDLYDALALTACSVVPEDGNNGQQPLPATACTSLYNNWESTRDKLDKCLTAANAPKQSEAIRNCQSANSQLDNFEATLRQVPACVTGQPCRDLANRRGDLLSRLRTFRHMFNDRFLPSVPANGFDDPAYDQLWPMPTRPPL